MYPEDKGLFQASEVLSLPCSIIKYVSPKTKMKT